MSQSEVETTRPFRSVKEAAAAFSKRQMTVLPFPPEPHSISKHMSGMVTNPKPVMCEISVRDSIKKLEMEMMEIKQDLAFMKKRGREMEIEFAGINAQFHKSLSKLAEIEAAQAGEQSVNGESYDDEIQYLPSFGDALSINGEMKVGNGTDRKVQKDNKTMVTSIRSLFKKKSHTDGIDCSYADSIYSVLN